MKGKNVYKVMFLILAFILTAESGFYYGIKYYGWHCRILIEERIEKMVPVQTEHLHRIDC